MMLRSANVSMPSFSCNSLASNLLWRCLRKSAMQHGQNPALRNPPLANDEAIGVSTRTSSAPRSIPRLPNWVSH